MKTFGKRSCNFYRLTKIQKSPQFSNNAFHNIYPTIMYPITGSAIKTACKFLTSKIPHDIKVTVAPARHYSGRGLNRNKTLWTAYVPQVKNYKIFIGADSGYYNQLNKIGKIFKEFDLALLECGQYNEKILMPVRWGKFILSLHTWTEPIKKLLVRPHELNLQIATFKIGDVFSLNEVTPQSDWWLHV